MRICIDLDGVVCQLREPEQTYADVQPVPGAVEKLKSLRRAGHYIILYTARHMKTCGGNVGQVIARQGATTLQWLEKHGVECDEFHFGKPHADVYIDDNAIRFEGWDKIVADGSSLPVSTESKHAEQTAVPPSPLAGEGSGVRGKELQNKAGDGSPNWLSDELVQNSERKS